MTSCDIKNGLLKLQVFDRFDFEASRMILLKCKMESQDIRAIELHLQNIESCEPCAFEVLVMVAGTIPRPITVWLNGCQPGVYCTFESGPLSSLFKVRRPGQLCEKVVKSSILHGSSVTTGVPFGMQLAMPM